MLLVQTDVTSSTERETEMVRMNEAQLLMLEQVMSFPAVGVGD